MGSPGTAVAPGNGPRQAGRTTTTARSWRRWCAGPHRLTLAGPSGRVRLLEDGGQPLYRWRQQGIFERLLAEIHRRADASGELDWLVHCVDGSVVRAHQHAAGARHQPALEDLKGGSSIASATESSAA